VNTCGESSGCGTPCVTLRSSTACGSDAGISQHGLKEHGGWSDTQVPDQIYPDQEAEWAREEAKGIRAQIRGEPSATGPAPVPGFRGHGHAAPATSPKPGTRTRNRTNPGGSGSFSSACAADR